MAGTSAPQPAKGSAPYRFNQSDFIDSHKFVTPFVLFAMLVSYGQWDNPTAWTYLATHGTYGLLWVCKRYTSPDKRFMVPCSIGAGVAGVWGPLSLYWIAGWLVMSRGTQVAPWFLGLCVALFSSGVFFHYIADMHKHVHQQYAKGTLLTSGLFAASRNPNYLGELLIYVSYVLLAQHWLPVVVLLFMIFAIWLPNMQNKDKSMSRYKEFAAWKARTSRLIPYIY